MDLVNYAIEIMWKGTLAVFIVAVVIIIFVWALNFLTGDGIKKTIANRNARKQIKKQKKNDNNS